MRIFDILASIISLIILSPLMLAVAVVIWLTSPGPVLYRARRVGRDGVLFTMFKFRTMRVDDGRTPRITAGDDDPRVTRIGRVLRKYKLDELPQLFNVLAGQMAVVGPRPEDPSFLSLYTDEEHGVLSVRPGLTGPVQLIYRELAEQHLHPDEDPTTFYVNHVLHRRLAMDLAYAETRSAVGDLRLILQTVRHIVTK